MIVVTIRAFVCMLFYVCTYSFMYYLLPYEVCTHHILWSQTKQSQTRWMCIVHTCIVYVKYLAEFMDIQLAVSATCSILCRNIVCMCIPHFALRSMFWCTSCAMYFYGVFSKVYVFIAARPRTHAPLTPNEHTGTKVLDYWHFPPVLVSIGHR